MISKDIILEQGYKPIIIALIIVVILELFISSFLSNIALFITIFILFIYRNPKRHVFSNKNSVLSPIDAKVIAIDNVNGKQQVYCKVNLCNTHILRAPTSGKIKIRKYQHGLNLNPNSYKASILNEQITVKFNDLKLKLISGFCNTKIEFTQKEIVNQGDDIGLFIDGLAILTIKKEYKLLVNIGDSLKASQTILFKNNQ